MVIAVDEKKVKGRVPLRSYVPRVVLDQRVAVLPGRDIGQETLTVADQAWRHGIWDKWVDARQVELATLQQVSGAKTVQAADLDADAVEATQVIAQERDLIAVHADECLWMNCDHVNCAVCDTPLISTVLFH